LNLVRCQIEEHRAHARIIGVTGERTSLKVELGLLQVLPSEANDALPGPRQFAHDGGAPKRALRYVLTRNPRLNGGDDEGQPVT
jgi:hypothetical protein